MGLTVLDAGIVIAVLDADDVHHDGARRAVAETAAAGDELVLPASALAETLVHPARRGPDAVARVEDFLAAMPIHVYPLSRDVAREAALVRARHPRLKLPDALVIASATALDADRLVTTDRRWPRRSELGLRATMVQVGPR